MIRLLFLKDSSDIVKQTMGGMEIVAVVQSIGYGDLDHDDCTGERARWRFSGNILEIDMTGFDQRLDMDLGKGSNQE